MGKLRHEVPELLPALLCGVPSFCSGWGDEGTGAAMRTTSCRVSPPPGGTQESWCVSPAPEGGNVFRVVTLRGRTGTRCLPGTASPLTPPTTSPVSPVGGSALVSPFPPGKPQHTGAGFVPWPCTCRCPHRTPRALGTCCRLASQPRSLGPRPNTRSPRQKVAIYDMLQKKKSS